MKPATHVVVPKSAFSHFDVIADLALRHGGLEAMKHVQAFTAAVREYTPEMPDSLKKAMEKRGAELIATQSSADNEAPHNDKTETE